MPRLDLVYNAHSGSFREDRLGALVEAFEEQGFTVTALETQADGVRLTGTAELICVHGGDGTLRDTIKAMIARGFDTPLCIARSGTINLVARELGYPSDPTSLAAMVARGWASGGSSWVSSPLFMMDEMPIASCLSLGPDSHAVARVSGVLKKRIGRLAYVMAMLGLLLDWPRRSIRLSGEMAGGELFTIEAEAAFVARGAFYAGPFRLSPGASLASEAVELVTLRRANRLRVLMFALAVMLRWPVNRFGIAEIRTVCRVGGESGRVPIQVDGDLVQANSLAIAPSGQSIRYVV